MFFFSFLIVIPPSTNLKLKCIFSRYVRILFNVGNSFSSNFFDMTLLLKTFLLFKYTETYSWIFVTKWKFWRHCWMFLEDKYIYKKKIEWILLSDTFYIHDSISHIFYSLAVLDIRKGWKWNTKKCIFKVLLTFLNTYTTRLQKSFSNCLFPDIIHTLQQYLHHISPTKNNGKKLFYWIYFCIFTRNTVHKYSIYLHSSIVFCWLTTNKRAIACRYVPTTYLPSI